MGINHILPLIIGIAMTVILGSTIIPSYIEEIKSLGNYNNAVPSLFIFDEKGAITRKDPEEVIKNELVLRPGIYYRKSDNELIIYSSRKKLDKLGRLVLEN